MAKLFTSESVSEGHPDKIADQISDAVLDAILKQDTKARVACETLVKTGMVMVAGEVTTSAWVDIEEIVRDTVREIGYTHSDMGFDADSCAVLNAIGKQSPDINQGVDRSDPLEQGAGDQGLMFGYATNETDVLMPAPITYSHLLVKRQAEVRKNGTLPWLRPDAKSQLTFAYDDAGKIIGVDAVVLSTQHAESISHKDLVEAVREEIIKPVLPAEWVNKDTKYFIRYFQPTGKGELRMENGTVLLPNDLYLLPEETFRLYYRSFGTDQQKIDIYILDSFGQVVQKSFAFNNEAEDEKEDTE